jgi:hypothetical protein
MFDVIAVISLVTLFGLAVMYVYGCERLNGRRP